MHYKNNDPSCPVQKTLEMIGGKWHTIILHYLSDGAKRYGELRRLLPAVSEKMLIQSLKELEKNGIVYRHAEATIPPRVEYSLTDHGKTLLPVIEAMHQWGMQAQARAASNPL